jgi:hypothetical protein
MCVQSVDDQCVLQFTLINAAGCALHRRTNPVTQWIDAQDVFRTYNTPFQIRVVCKRTIGSNVICLCVAGLFRGYMSVSQGPSDGIGLFQDFRPEYGYLFVNVWNRRSFDLFAKCGILRLGSRFDMRSTLIRHA